MQAAPILIVGAGPTGLMLACQLARFGVDFMIVDGKDGPTRESRALGVQARTLELYDTLGLAQAAVAQGHPTVALNLFVRRRHVRRIPIGDIGRGSTAYPFVLILEQSRNEMLLHGRLRDYGHDVHWGTSLASLKQAGDGVDVELATPDGRVRQARFERVVGCDGARSAVRTFCGLQFTGGTYRNAFYVADTRVDGDIPADELSVCLSQASFVLFFPMTGDRRYRIVGTLPADRDGDGVDDAPDARGAIGMGRPPVHFDEIDAAVRAQLDIPVRFSETHWFSAYRVHHRCVERFDSGRCYLAGDSAHVHSPVGAQGMNTGLQDACNLAWKLALVTQGRADARLLDTYHEERWPIARTLLRTTDNAFRLVVSPSRVIRAVRMHVFPWLAARLMQQAPVRRRLFRTVSQIGLNYRGRRLSRDRSDGRPGARSTLAVRAGDRLPHAMIDPPLSTPALPVHRWLPGPGLQVLLLDRADGPAGSEDLAAVAARLQARLDALYPGLLEVRAIGAHDGGAGLLEAVGVSRCALLAVRPDQYLGFVAESARAADVDVDALLRWLADDLGLLPSGSAHRP